MPEDSDVNPFEEELKEDSYTGNLETNVTEAQIDAEHWYHDPEEWWRDSSNYQRQAMLVGAGITDMNLASFEYYDLSEDIQRQLAEDSITYSPESKASNTCPNCGSSDVGDGEDYGYKKDGEFPHLAGSSYQCNNCGKKFDGESKAKEEGTSDGAKKGWLTRKRGGSSAEEPSNVDHDWAGSVGYTKNKADQNRASDLMDKYYELVDKPMEDLPVDGSAMVERETIHAKGERDFQEYLTTTGRDVGQDVKDILEDENYHSLNRMLDARMETKKNPYDDDLNIKSGIDYDDPEVSDSQSDQDYYDGITQNTVETLQQSTVNGFPFFAYVGRPEEIFKDGKGGVVLYGMKKNPNSVRKVDIMYDEGMDTYSVRFVGNKGKVKGEYSDIYFDQLSDIIVGKKGLGVESKASENLTFYEDASHGWLEVPKSLLKELGIADQISSYSYQSGDMAYLEEDADLSLFISNYGNVNTNNPQDGKHIRNYGSYVGESVAWTNASFNRKLDALESLGITQGDAVRLASVAYEDLSEDLKKDLELPYTEEDAETEQEIFAQNEEKEEDVDYNNIGESRTARTKYECEHCNCGFKSNESLSTHYNQIHAVVRTPIEGYENWKDVADDLYEKEQSRRKKGGEYGMQVNWNYSIPVWWDSLSQDERNNYMNSFSMTPNDGTIYMDNYDEMDSSNQYYVKRLFTFITDDMDNDLLGRNHDLLSESKASEALDPMWFEKFAGRSGVKRIPVENFLGTIDMNADQMSAWGNFERDASMYNWNSKTKKAISDGIVYYYNNAGESKANESFHSSGNTDFIDYTTINEDEIAICDLCGKTWDMNDGYTKVDDIENHLSLVHDKAFESKASEVWIDIFYYIQSKPQGVTYEELEEKFGDRSDFKYFLFDHILDGGASKKLAYWDGELIKAHESKSSESLQSTLNRGFDNMMVMDQSDMFRCKECSQMFDIWRIEHELHQDPEEVLNSHLQSHESKANEIHIAELPYEFFDKSEYTPHGKQEFVDFLINVKGYSEALAYVSMEEVYDNPENYKKATTKFSESYANEDFVHQAGYPPESASDKPYDWWEGQGEFMIDTTKDDLHQEIKMAGDIGVYDVSINNGLVGVDANAWELVKAKEELEREGKIKRGSRYDKMFEGGEWEPYGHKEPSEYWFDSSVNFGSESYAKEDSLVKIEDNNDDDTQVTVLDEWENETDPDVGGKTEDINESKASEGEWENELAMDWWKGLSQSEQDEIRKEEPFILSDNDLIVEQYMKRVGESKATEFDYNKWENAEDGNVLVPDEDLKEIKDLEKQLDGENVCPECGDKTDDDKEFEDHLNTHRFEEEV